MAPQFFFISWVLEWEISVFNPAPFAYYFSYYSMYVSGSVFSILLRINNPGPHRFLCTRLFNLGVHRVSSPINLLYPAGFRLKQPGICN